MIRRAVESDLDILVEMAEAMHGESPFYSGVDFIEEDMRDFFGIMLQDQHNNCLLLSESSGLVAGMFGAWLIPYVFNGGKYYSCDIGFYIRPDHRGGRHALGLINAYEEWARAKGAWPIKLGESTGTNPESVDAFLKKKGYTAAGTLYMKTD